MHIATLMLLGSGELGKEFAIAAKRLGCRVIACDRYANAPAMQVADASEVFPMLDGAALRVRPFVRGGRGHAAGGQQAASGERDAHHGGPRVGMTLAS